MVTVDHMTSNNMSGKLLPIKVIKYYKKGRPLGSFSYRVYKDKQFFVTACLKEYISQWDVDFTTYY